jgi:ParB family chromosome partitioning protein
MASIDDTGFWDNILVRPHPEKPGFYQLAYGHTRLEAAKRCGVTHIAAGSPISTCPCGT